MNRVKGVPPLEAPATQRRAKAVAKARSVGNSFHLPSCSPSNIYNSLLHINFSILFVHACLSSSCLTYQQCQKSTSMEETTYQPTMILLPRMVQILGASLYIISGNTSLCALHKQNNYQFRPLERMGREKVCSYDYPHHSSFIAHIFNFSLQSCRALCRFDTRGLCETTAERVG